MTGPLRIYAALVQTEILKVMKEDSPRIERGEFIFRKELSGKPAKMLHSTKTKPAKIWNLPWQFDTASSSSCDDSSQSVRSVSPISSLLNGKFGSAYKKRKIREASNLYV